MANNVLFYYTQFVDLSNNGDKENFCFGYRITDDYGQEYNNTFESFEALNETISLTNILEYLKENHEGYYWVVAKQGIYFNDTKYTFQELLALQNQ